MKKPDMRGWVCIANPQNSNCGGFSPERCYSSSCDWGMVCGGRHGSRPEPLLQVMPSQNTTVQQCHQCSSSVNVTWVGWQGGKVKGLQFGAISVPVQRTIVKDCHSSLLVLGLQQTHSPSMKRKGQYQENQPMWWLM